MNKEKFREEVMNLIDICILEIQHKKAGINGESTIEQLQNIVLPELNELIIKIDNNELPPSLDLYLLSFANAFKVWGWDMNNPTKIFTKLSYINNHYLKI